MKDMKKGFKEEILEEGKSAALIDFTKRYLKWTLDGWIENPLIQWVDKEWMHGTRISIGKKLHFHHKPDSRIKLNKLTDEEVWVLMDVIVKDMCGELPEKRRSNIFNMFEDACIDRK